jgi:hypothetical protein
MREPRTETIEGFQITTQELGGLTGLELGADIARALGPAYARILELGGDPEADVDFAPIVNALFSNLTAKAIGDIAPRLLARSSTVYEGRRVGLGNREAIDLVFAGKTYELLAVLKHVAAENYSDFFARAMAEITTAMAKIKAAEAAAAAAKAAESKSTLSPG